MRFCGLSGLLPAILLTPQPHSVLLLLGLSIEAHTQSIPMFLSHHLLHTLQPMQAPLCCVQCAFIIVSSLRHFSCPQLNHKLIFQKASFPQRVTSSLEVKSTSPSYHASVTFVICGHHDILENKISVFYCFIPRVGTLSKHPLMRGSLAKYKRHDTPSPGLGLMMTCS